jgi:hypothetical protein
MPRGWVGRQLWHPHLAQNLRANHACKQGVPIEIIMEKVNHNSFAFTKRYLEITDDELCEAAESVNL